MSGKYQKTQFVYFFYKYLKPNTSLQIYKPGTGMSNEQTYTSHLLTFGEAMAKLYGAEKRVLQYAWDVYHHTIKLEKMRRRERQEENQNQQSSSSRRSSKVRIVLNRLALLTGGLSARLQPAIREESPSLASWGYAICQSKFDLHV